MPRRAAKVDSNQAEIVADLRKLGFSVQHLHTVGQGVPDLLVGWNGLNHLLEIKDGSLPPSKRKLSALQDEWHEAWRGSVVVLSTRDEVEAWARSVRGERTIPKPWRSVADAAASALSPREAAE